MSLEAKSLPTNRNFANLVEIEAVYLLVHQNSKIYRKLLAPEPKTPGDVHFIKTIRLIENSSIQFEFDFRVLSDSREDVNAGEISSESGSVNNRGNEISLLFHEILRDNRGTVCSFYVENMSKYGCSPARETFRYTTEPFSGYLSKFTNKPHSLGIELIDLDRSVWFSGEWKIRFQSASFEATEWLLEGNQNKYGKADVSSEIASSMTPSIDKDDSFSLIDDEEFRIQSQDFSTLKLPSSFPSRSPSPLCSSVSSEKSDDLEFQLKRNSPTVSIAASFEDLDLNDFSDINRDLEDSLSLPPKSPNIKSSQNRPLLAKELASTENARRSSHIPSRTGTPSHEDDEDEENLSTVDLFHQVGTNLFSSRIGQIVSASIKSDPNAQNIKTAFSTSTIHVLGVRYQLQGLQSNVLFMESEAARKPEEPSEKPHNNYNCRFNTFCGLMKRMSPPLGRVLALREVLFVKMCGPIVTSHLQSWFQAFPQWEVEEFTSATLRVKLANSIGIQIRVFSLTASAAAAPTEELYLIELLLNRTLLPPNLMINNFHSIAESNAFFVELTASIVQMEIAESGGRPPEIVMMETWNAHVGAERLFRFESIPAVKFSVIPEPTCTTPFKSFVYFWSEHLQGWLLQGLRIQGLVLSIHPLLDSRMAIQLNLSDSHLRVSQDLEECIGNFTLVTSQGQIYRFRSIKGSDLKEIIGRLRFSMLSSSPAAARSTKSVVPRRGQRQGSLLQADRIYRGAAETENTKNAASAAGGGNAANFMSPQEIQKIREQNTSVMDAFIEDFETRFWFTYRKNFPRIEPSLFTTDLGWGCMLRTGQSLMAEALARFHFGRDWRLWHIQDGEIDVSDQNFTKEVQEKIKLMKRMHSKILQTFVDDFKGDYSVHRLAVEGAKIGTPIGQWFGPSIIGKVLKSITNNLKDSPFWVYLSPNGLFPTSHLLKIVSERAALILLPLRLGIDSLNPIYAQFIKGALRSPFSLGIVGGLPDKSLYFVGYQDWDLLFLDPHILRPFDSTDFSSSEKLIQDFHTNRIRSIQLDEIDPSMVFGFLCCSAEEVVQLRDNLCRLNRNIDILSINNNEE